MNKLCNEIIIALLVSILIGVPLFFDVRLYSVFDLSKITLLYFLTFGLIVTWCVKRIFSSEDSYTYNILLIPISCYVLVSVVSTVFAIDSSTSLMGTYKRYNGLFSLLIYFFIFFIITNYVKMDMVDFFVKIIILSACLTCVYGIMQRYGGDPFRWNTNFGHGGRIFSTIGHPAFFSAYIIMALPLVYYKIIKSDNWYSFGLYMFCVGLMLIAFYMSKTRATFIGLILSNIFFAAFIGKEIILRYKLKIAVIVGIVLLVSIVMNIKNNDSPFKRIIMDVSVGGSGIKLSHTADTRKDNVLSAIEIIKDYPVFGVGLDNFGIVFPEYILKVYKKRGEANRPIAEMQDRVHSDFFDIAVSTGLLGLAAYLWCIYTYLRMLWKARDAHRLLVLALGTGVFAYLCQNQFSFGHVPILILFWFLIGISVVVCKTNTLIRLSTHS